MYHLQKHVSALRLSCGCFPSRVSIKQANAIQLVPLPMALAAFTAKYQLHRESLDKQAVNTNNYADAS